MPRKNEIWQGISAPKNSDESFGANQNFVVHDGWWRSEIDAGGEAEGKTDSEWVKSEMMAYKFDIIIIDDFANISFAHCIRLTVREN